MAAHGNVLQRINNQLADGWEAKLSQNGRIYYISHHTQTTSWLPPRENWDPGSGLPYGWELAIDRAEKPYFINHVEKYTTREDPRDDPDYVEPPTPREVELIRDPDKGFGFVAGSEKPVIVRFVTEGGPSVDKLLPADQIIKINGEDVKRAPREYVIDLVRSCKHSIKLTVCQPFVDNSSRKSAILTAAKKARLKSNPSRVRFADSVIVNGASVHGPSAQESYVPLMPNVLKVFLENGQTKSFKYDNKTTVKDVLDSMQEKLNIKRIEHFALVLQNTKSSSHGKLSILQEQETLAEIAARPGAMHFRCLFRVTFVPKDAYDLLREDTIAFEYFYMQCCNDVVQERFAAELKYDTALRLAALQIQQHVMSNNVNNKISLKTVERDCGLERFVPPSLLDSMKGKDVRKMIQQYLKMNQSLSAPGQKQLTALQAKLHYLKIISELKTFGSRIFMVTLLDKRAEGMVLVGPKSGVSLITNIKSYATALLTDFDDIESITISKEGENMYRVDISLSDENLEHICLGLLYEDMNNFLALVEGYHRIFVENSKSLLLNIPYKTHSPDLDTPPYEAQHKVVASTWSYPEDVVSQVITPAAIGVLSDNVCEDERIVDLSAPPPVYYSNGTKLTIRNDLTETTSSEDSTSTDEASVLSKDSQEDAVHNNLQPVTLRNKLGNFDEGVTSFGRESSSSEPEIESLVEVHVNKNGVESSESDSVSENSQILVEEGNLKTFTRYVPSPIASLNKRRKHTNLDKSESEVSLPEDILRVSVEDSCFHIDTLSRQEVDSSASDADTDSVFGAETERKPLLLSHNAADDSDGVGEYRNNHVVPLESDDTDSWEETPEGSPAKHLESTPRPSSASAKLNLGDLPQSFGLHSPDQLPTSEQDYHKMATSFGLHSPDQIPPDMYNAVYDPRLFCDGGLYLDPDIIEKVRKLTAESSFPMQHFTQGDLPTELWLLFYMVNCYTSEASSGKLRGASPCDLTLIPPPKTPDDDLVIDFSSMANSPPPGFTDNGSLSPGTSHSTGKKAPMSRQELETQFELLCRLDDDKEPIGPRLSDCVFAEDESDSGNETISSENIELTNGLADSLGQEPAGLAASAHHQRVSNRTVGAASGGQPQLNSFPVNPLSELNTDIDDLIARLTVPPPPSTGNTTTTEQKIKSYKKSKQRSKRSSWSPADRPLSPSINELSLEEEIAALIIPPPPLSPALIDIPIVPPVTPDNSHQATSKMKKLSPHKRSSSVDLSLLRKHSTDQSLESSVESGHGSKFKRKAPKPPEHFKMDRRHLSADDVHVRTKEHADVESPSTVSERLTSLLKSIPFENLDEENPHSSLIKTWSHRERKDSGISSHTNRHNNGSGTKIARSSSLRVRRSPSSQLNGNVRQMSMSSERLHANSFKHNGRSSSTPSKEFVPKSILKSRSVETMQHSESSKGSGDTSGKSDTFTALKAKLQEYRDIMLRRRNGGAKSSQESSTVKGDKAGAKGQGKSSSLRRSTSMSEPSSINTSSTATGDNQKVSKRSFPRKQQSLSLTRSPFTTNNWSANENDGGKEEENSPEINVNSKDRRDKKKAPMKPLFNTLPVNFNKLSLKALAGTSVPQEIDGDHSVVDELPATESLQGRESKKRGPLKALKAVFESQGQASHKSSVSKEILGTTNHTPNNSGQVTGTTGVVKGTQANSDLVQISGRSAGSSNTTTSATASVKSSTRTYAEASSIFEENDFTTSSDVDEEHQTTAHSSFAESTTTMKRNGDLMMWRPISRKASANSSAGNSGTGSSTSNSDSSNGSTNMESSHNRALSVGSGKITVSRTPSWSQAPELEKSTRGPLIRGSSGSTRSRNGETQNDPACYPFVTAKYTNFIKFVLSKNYDTDRDITHAGNDVDSLVAELEQTMSSLTESRIDKQPSQLKMCRDELTLVTRQFVSDAKSLVTSATQSSAKLFDNVNSSIHTLAKMFLHCHATLLMMDEVPKALKLGQEMTRVADAYKKTVVRARQVMEQPLTDSIIRQLMKQATWLASLLGDLMKILLSVNVDS